MLETERPPRRPSPFAAAVLGLLFPGLGHVYAGAPTRGLAFAALPLLGTALVGGLLLNSGSRDALKVSFFDPLVLQALLAIDLAILLYRILAIVDGFRVAAAMSARAGTDHARLGPPRVRVHPGAVGALLVVLVVASMGHVALARYDRIAYDTITSIAGGDEGDLSSIPGASAAVGSTGATSSPDTGATEQPRSTPVPWNGTDRLNVLLIGADRRPKEGSFNTDTLLVASIDPSSGQVAMFSVPRDTENVPLPADWPAHDYYANGVFPAKINSLWMYAKGAPNLYPGTDANRGFEALKGALGELMGIDIKYYVEVDFDGFKKVIDTLGGVVIDVQLPVADYHYPSDDGRGALNLYIPPGIQVMDGDEALAYARSRHGTNDFDRAQRQQRVVTSLRQQSDVLSFLDPGRLDNLSKALRAAVHTDYPAAQLPQLISLIEKVDLGNLRSYVFTPPVYQQECAPADCQVKYTLTPKVQAIRQAVREAFTVDPVLQKSRLKLASEGGDVWVLNGSGVNGQAATVADYLAYLGVGAQVPPVNGGLADKLTYKKTVLTFYNGAELKMPETVQVLEKAFGVQIVAKDDAAVTVDVIVITGKSTPDLQVPQ
jgi:LCP family protein required for cell wall assembly